MIRPLMLLLLLSGIVLSACSTSVTGTPMPDINATVAASIAETMAAGIFQTQTALVPTATHTALPTATVLTLSAPTSVSPTALPSAIANPLVECNDLKVISSYTIPEGPFQPGQAFMQSWQVENSGTCSWDSSYQLLFVSGENLGGSPHTLNKTIPPGKLTTFSLDLYAPDQNGTYTSAWRFSAAERTPFGATLEVTIVVGENAPDPARTEAYIQTVEADQATANAIGRETVEPALTPQAP